MTDPFDTMREALGPRVPKKHASYLESVRNNTLDALASIEERLREAERHLGKMPSPERIAIAHSRLPAEWFKSGLAAKANAGAGHFAYYQAPEGCYLCTLIGLWEAAERERDECQRTLDACRELTGGVLDDQHRAEAAEARIAELEAALREIKDHPAMTATYVGNIARAALASGKDKP